MARDKVLFQMALTEFQVLLSKNDYFNFTEVQLTCLLSVPECVSPHPPVSNPTLSSSRTNAEQSLSKRHGLIQ